MRFLTVTFLTAIALIPLTGQIAPENAAAGSLAKKVLSINFVELLARKSGSKRYSVPKVCAVHLLDAKPDAFTERMPVSKMLEERISREREVELPAPACR